MVAMAGLVLWTGRLSGADRREAQLRKSAATALRRGLAFLEQRQRENGEFPTYAWFANHSERRGYVATPFTASQILHSISFAGRDEADRRMIKRTLFYLLSEREPPGVWRYYAKGRAPHLISPDVDDTAQAWAALSEHGVGIDPQALEALRSSRAGSGLFNTWIGDPSEWVGIDSKEISLVVNLNALFLFSREGQSLPEVCRAAVAYTKTKAFENGTGYYPSPLAYTYFFTRAYADGRAACLKEGIPDVRAYAVARQRANGGWGNDLETALAVVTLLNAREKGPGVRRGIKALVDRQRPKGGWVEAPLYKGAVQPLYYGSASLTTAFCLEGLGKYLKR